MTAKSKSVVPHFARAHQCLANLKTVNNLFCQCVPLIKGLLALFGENLYQNSTKPDSM